MGVRIFRGEAPQAIPVVNRLYNPAIFDALRISTPNSSICCW